MADDSDNEKPEIQEEPSQHDPSKKHKHEVTGEGEAKPKEETRPVGYRRWQQLCRWFMAHKVVSIPASVVLLLTIVFVIPFSRYAVLGLFLKQDFSVVVVDSQTGRPVSSAEVSLRGRSTSTDAEGRATLRVPVGAGALAVTKVYYKTSSQEVVVPLTKQKSALTVKLKATGRAVGVTVLNAVSAKPVAGAVLSVGESKTKTNDKGEATLVVPSGKDEYAGELSGSGFNTTSVTIKATSQDKTANQFKLTPSGKVYFLSNQTGKIDVVESDLDGGNRKVIVAGTGKELKGQTVLLATRDWKYLALLSRRDGGEYDKLFLINTADGSLTIMDEGEAQFTLLGWSGHHFVYRVERAKLKYWQPKRVAIKSYAADKKDIILLDELGGTGNNMNDYTLEEYSYVGPYVLDDEVVFVKDWTTSNYPGGYSGKQVHLYRINVDGTNKKTVQTFGDAQYSSVDNGRSDGPYGAIFGVYTYSPGGDGARKYYVYSYGKLAEDKSINDNNLNQQNTYTYLASPEEKRTFWSELRDGKNSLFVGDHKGENGKQIAAKVEHQTYGWYTEDYLLVSKESSELYILPADGSVAPENYLKVTDYFKPDYTYRGYGGGYGGL